MFFMALGLNLMVLHNLPPPKGLVLGYVANTKVFAAEKGPKRALKNNLVFFYLALWCSSIGATPCFV